MIEPIYNVFLFVADGIIFEIGMTQHRHSGSDEEKLKYLQAKVDGDFRISRRFQLSDSFILVDEHGKSHPRQLSYETFAALQRSGTNQHMHVIEPAFAEMNAPANPLMVITPIVDGAPLIEGFVELSGETK